MNVFEDLIEELRDENLLEQTVIDLPKSTSVKSNGHESGQALNDPDGDVAESDSNGSHPNSGFDMPSAEPESEADFYRKRAIDEISSLQMVEHIFSGIEREHMKLVPAAYDDLEAKKALHKFLQVSADASTTDYADAEFNLMRETETWSSALSERDQKISVSNLRRFCENSRPVLSSSSSSWDAFRSASGAPVLSATSTWCRTSRSRA